jgi:anthranilate synthase component 1
MQPPFDIAADLDTPVSAYLKLTPLRPRFLLESVVGGATVGRYSIIGFGEAETVRIQPDDPGPLDTLRAALKRAPLPGEGIPGLPLAGGLVGVASYDLVRRFEHLPTHAAPLAGAPEALYVAPSSMLVFDHATRRCALLHAGTEAERAALRRDVVMALRGPIPARHSPLAHTGFRSGGFGSPRASMSKEVYEDGVRQIREHIAAGDVYQLVLSSAFEGECQLDPFQVYRALRLLNPSPYMTFLELDDFAVVGSSPEALVKLQGRRATLRPIAGTRRRGSTPAEDLRLEAELLADPKEAAEHVMLVDLARNDLGRVGVPGTIAVEPYRTIERYSHVMHIVSGVVGDIREGTDQFDLFAATFPAGTVVGAPKVRAMELIDELEPVRRGAYAGTVGYFGLGTAPDGSLQEAMDQAIAIRTLTFHGGRYRYQAGAGIVADSVPEREHDEILAKSDALRAALALAEEGL